MLVHVCMCMCMLVYVSESVPKVTDNRWCDMDPICDWIFKTDPNYTRNQIKFYMWAKIKSTHLHYPETPRILPNLLSQLAFTDPI